MSMDEQDHIDGNCNCEMCKYNYKFEMPHEIIEALENGNLVIFAGAGVSTESKNVFGMTLYKEVLSELGIPEENRLSFPDLMSLYCQKPNGRIMLLNKIKKRFDYLTAFPELYFEATRFHRALSTIPHINEIVTTNWDDFFERECGAVPIVSSKDLIFWNDMSRKVLKIHGSVNNYGSIIATKEQYRKSYVELANSPLGSFLKTLLSTKTIVFVGYSFGDDDFNRIYDLIKKYMLELSPHAYVVTTNKQTADKLSDLNVTSIRTDATYFLDVLKNELVKEEMMLPDSIFDTLKLHWTRISHIHLELSSKIKIKNFPEVIFTLAYQDGLIHSIDRTISKKNTGEYSCPEHIPELINGYNKLRKIKLSEKNYFDVSYIDGYIDGLGLILLSEEERERFNPYYLFGHDGLIKSRAEYLRLIRRTRKPNLNAYKLAKKIAERSGDGVSIHHKPFL